MSSHAALLTPVMAVTCLAAQVTRNYQGDEAIQEGEGVMALTEAEAAISSAFQELLLQEEGWTQPAAAPPPTLSWFMEVRTAHSLQVGKWFLCTCSSVVSSTVMASTKRWQAAVHHMGNQNMDEAALHRPPIASINGSFILAVYACS